MASLPSTLGVPFIRTDFSDQASWDQMKDVVGLPNEQDYQANVEYIEDRTLVGLDEAALVQRFPKLYPGRYEHPVVFVADAAAMSSPQHPILVVNLNEGDASRPFRSIPQEIASIEANLSLSNMDFYEFAGKAAETDGVFRGF